MFNSLFIHCHRWGRKSNGVLSPLVLALGFCLLAAALHHGPRAQSSSELLSIAPNTTSIDLDVATTTLSGDRVLYFAAAVLGMGSGLGSGLVMTLGTDLAPQDPAERGHFLALFRVITDSGILLGSVRNIFFLYLFLACFIPCLTLPTHSGDNGRCYRCPRTRVCYLHCCCLQCGGCKPARRMRSGNTSTF